MPNQTNPQQPATNSQSLQNQGTAQPGSGASQWDPNGKASAWWFLIGVVPFGNLIAIIYVLMSESKKKIFSLLYLIGFLGPLIVFVIVKDEDHKLGDLSIKLAVGNILSSIVLIIAVVLGALFSLGVFSGGTSLARASCIGEPGFMCTAPVMGTSGQLSMTFGQVTGTTIYNVMISCAATSTSAGLPSTGTSSSFEAIEPSGAATTDTSILGSSTTALSLPNGQEVQITGLTCYGSNGAPASAPVGTSYSGYLWINYTTSASPPYSWTTTKFATLTLKVS